MGLDLVELVLTVEEAFGIEITNSQAEKIRTPKQLEDFVCLAVNASDGPSRCISQAAFYEIRRYLLETTTRSRRAIRPHTRLRELFRGPDGKKRWLELKRRLAVKEAGEIHSFSRRWFAPKTVKDLVAQLMADRSAKFHANHSWTRGEVRGILHLHICEQLGIKNFKNDDDFIYDLGAG